MSFLFDESMVCGLVDTKKKSSQSQCQLHLILVGLDCRWLLLENQPSCHMTTHVHLYFFLGWVLVLGKICDDGQWTCLDGKRCIDAQYVCDGLIHCRDASDEKDKTCTSWQCGEDMWKCKNNVCIEVKSVCDTSRDCTDDSDEDPDICQDWPCPWPRQWRCKDGSKCIYDIHIMDGHPSCNDESDEILKYHIGRNCPDGTIRCNNGQCIGPQWCDGYVGCTDGTDEDPIICRQWNCTAGSSKCDDGLRCVHKNDLCDGFTFCNDGSDEDPSICENCPEDSRSGCTFCPLYIISI